MEFNRWDTFKYITAVTTKRHGGVSKEPYGSLNLAYHVGDDHDAVVLNRKLLLAALDIREDQLVATYQSHSDIIVKVTRQQGGAGALTYESGIAADALYTYDTDLALAIFHADCTPVFIYDRVRKWVGVIHAGTPGTLLGITAKALTQLIKDEGSRPGDIFAYLGPALTFANHPLKEAEKDRILSEHPEYHFAIKKSDGVYFLDVPLLNYGQLRALNVPAKNIVMSGIDTLAAPEDYFSFTRDKKTGRHMSIIMLNRR